MACRACLGCVRKRYIVSGFDAVHYTCIGCATIGSSDQGRRWAWSCGAGRELSSISGVSDASSPIAGSCCLPVLPCCCLPVLVLGAGYLVPIVAWDVSSGVVSGSITQ